MQRVPLAVFNTVTTAHRDLSALSSAIWRLFTKFLQARIWRHWNILLT